MTIGKRPLSDVYFAEMGFLSRASFAVSLLNICSCTSMSLTETHTPSEFSGLGAASSLDAVDLAPVRKDCVDRINASAQVSNKQRKSANTWATVLGFTGGLGAGFGVVAAANTDTLGKATPYVSGGVAAVSAILAPFVTSKDEASKTAGEYSMLMTDMRKASQSSPQESYDSLMDCAYGHIEFVTPPRTLPQKVPPRPTPEARTSSAPR